MTSTIEIFYINSQMRFFWHCAFVCAYFHTLTQCLITTNSPLPSAISFSLFLPVCFSLFPIPQNSLFLSNSVFHCVSLSLGIGPSHGQNKIRKNGNKCSVHKGAQLAFSALLYLHKWMSVCIAVWRMCRDIEYKSFSENTLIFFISICI